MINLWFCTAVAMTTIVAAGCKNPAVQTAVTGGNRIVPYVSTAELNAKLVEEGSLVLVEFCVPSGCFRCDEMRTQIDRLASEIESEIAICRVDLNRDPVLATRFEVTMCPSYIAFIDGQEVFRIAYPTSGDLVFAKLENALQPSVFKSSVKETLDGI